jgi:SAM-dependent methyltransferase
MSASTTERVEPRQTDEHIWRRKRDVVRATETVNDIGHGSTFRPLTMPELTAATYRKVRSAHWDRVAIRSDRWSGLGGYYHRRLEEVYSFLVAPGQKILECGSGTGNLLAAARPSVGVGVDFSAEMNTRATQKHPELTILHVDVHDLGCLDGPFDVIILSDLVDDLWDVQATLKGLERLCTPKSRIIINCYSRIWEPALVLAQKLGLSKARLPQNWLTREDVVNLLSLTNFEAVRLWEEILLPFGIPILSSLFNKVLVRLWPFKLFALSNFILARPKPTEGTQKSEPIVSVIVPARNEAGNIEHVFSRTPEMGAGTELIFVEGHSTDGTYGTIERFMAATPCRRCRVLRQQGKGKGDAVRLGFANAAGDVLMILDADLTVPPETLPHFYDAIVSGKGEFINGVRLVYPMEHEAMRFANLVANKFFSIVFSWLLGQRIKDTLCGTKVLWKLDYERIAANRHYFGDFDPFGDFDLLFGAAKQGLKIVDLPVRYRERTYGSTQIQRWRHGLLLLQMSLFACRRVKFV